MLASMSASSGWPSTHSSTRYGTGTPFGRVETSTSIDFTMPASARDSPYMSRPSAMNFDEPVAASGVQEVRDAQALHRDRAREVGVVRAVHVPKPPAPTTVWICRWSLRTVLTRPKASAESPIQVAPRRAMLAETPLSAVRIPGPPWYLGPRGRAGGRMALGLGRHAGHRLGVGRAATAARSYGGGCPGRASWCGRTCAFGRGCSSRRSTIWRTSARGSRPSAQRPAPRRVTYRELEGLGALRYLVRADDGRALGRGGARGRVASACAARCEACVRELGEGAVLALPPEEQYLVASGRTYFRDLEFDELRRAQMDLETTGLDPRAGQDLPRGAARSARRRPRARGVRRRRRRGGRSAAPGVEEALQALDPDVIENHNLHGFDLPFLARRAQKLGCARARTRRASPVCGSVRRRAVAR